MTAGDRKRNEQRAIVVGLTPHEVPALPHLACLTARFVSFGILSGCTCDYPFRSLTNAVGDYRPYREIRTMLYPMAGQNVYSRRINPRGEFNIMRVIPDHEGAPKVNTEFPLRLLQEVGVGFDAPAA